MRNYVLFIVTVLLTFSSCDKVEYVDAPPQICFTVVDEGGALVEGADVNLYATYDDWYAMTNPLCSGKTDVDGKCLFAELQEVFYFFDVEKGEEMGNSSNNSSIEESLKSGVVTNITVILKKFDL